MKKALFFLLLLFAPLAALEPTAIYATYLSDPSTSITIRWLTDKKTQPELYYRMNPSDPWTTVAPATHKVDPAHIFVHTANLSSLIPDTTYTLLIKDHPTPYTFHTLPSTLTHPVRFVVGGDAYRKMKLFHKMNKQIAKLTPDFIVIGGDIAYTQTAASTFHSKKWEARRWRTFFQTLTHDLTPKNRLIPILPVIGNHDIPKHKTGETPFLFQFFASADPTYRTLPLGTYATLILLDTNHYAPIAGPQTAFLQKTLETAHPYRFAIYHVAAYPSYYSYNHPTSEAIRTHWVPLFEKHRLTAALENHNHTFKRTYPLLQNKPNPDGIPYLGDGSWGVPPRRPRPQPYLLKIAQTNAVWLLTLTPQGACATAFDLHGQVIDSLPLK